MLKGAPSMVPSPRPPGLKQTVIKQKEQRSNKLFWEEAIAGKQGRLWQVQEIETLIPQRTGMR